MSYSFFSDSDPDMRAYAQTVEPGDVRRGDVQKLVDEVQKHVVVPLETLNRNRPGNENNEMALEKATALCQELKSTLASTRPSVDENVGSSKGPAV